MKPLDSYRVIELGVGPITGIAGMICADFGAEVIKIDPPAGDPFDDMAASRMWRRGKKILAIDLHDPNAVDELRSLIRESADAVVTNLPSGKLARLQLDADTFDSDRPDLVYGVVSGFGESGPYRDYPGYEGIVAAKSGRMLNFAGVADREGPNYSALQVGTHATAQSLVTGLVASLDARERTGSGRVFYTSLLRGMMPYEMGVVSMAQLYDKGILPRPQVARDRTKSMPTLNYHPVRTKDGKWLQLGNLLPHLLENYFRASGFGWVLEDENYKGESMRWDRQRLEDFRDEMFDHMQTRTIDEWMDHYVADGGVVAHPYQTTQEALSDPDVTANGHVVQQNGEIQLGLVANLLECGGRVGDPPQSSSISSLQERRVSRPPSSDTIRRPLEGITVVESATIIAAPLGAATLADMGARVIKLEPITGDPFRSMMSALGASKCNTGKESICLDLKRHEGQRIAHSLAQMADVWIHNYRIGVPERLGIDYDTLSSSNPSLVYISANGYGPAGPGAKRPSTHPIPGAALGGVVWQIGGLPSSDVAMTNEELREMARKLLRANEVNPDPNTSMVVATAATLGLCARRRLGHGLKIFIDMFGANAYANWDDFLDYPGKPERPPVDTQGYGMNPLYRLYQCSEGWVFVAAISEKERSALESALNVSATAEDIEDQLAAIFVRKDAASWEAELGNSGFGCVEASAMSPPEFFLNDEHVKAERLLVPAIHPDWGEYLRLGPMVEFDPEATYPGASAAGDSTVSLLQELGYGESRISELLEDRTVRAAS